MLNKWASLAGLFVFKFQISANWMLLTKKLLFHKLCRALKLYFEKSPTIKGV